MQRIVALLQHSIRVVSLLTLAVVCTTVLMLSAPGYFADAREMDSRYAASVQSDLAVQQRENGSLLSSTRHLLGGWFRGDLGRSRQFDVPVTSLLRERMYVTARLLMRALLLGWMGAFAIALPLSTRKRERGESIISLLTAALLCVPIALMAVICLVINLGGPVLVLGALIAIRDFKLLYRMLRQAGRAPQLLYAKSQGYSLARTARVHLLPSVRSELFALLMMSFVMALSGAVPVEVIFDRPGLGQLAWSAAMNRDLPVLAAITVLMAALVGLASVCAESQAPQEASCV